MTLVLRYASIAHDITKLEGSENIKPNIHKHYSSFL